MRFKRIGKFLKIKYYTTANSVYPASMAEANSIMKAQYLAQCGLVIAYFALENKSAKLRYAFLPNPQLVHSPRNKPYYLLFSQHSDKRNLSYQRETPIIRQIIGSLGGLATLYFKT